MSGHHHDSADDEAVLLAEAQTIVRDNVPGAREAWLREDEGHDDPEHVHGHLHEITGADGEVLMTGSSEDYQDAEWSWDFDDVVFALHRANPAAFSDTRPGDSRRFRRVPIA